MTQSNLRLGVIGLGRGFMLTLPALLGHRRIDLVGAADPRAEARARFTQEFRGRAYRDFTELIADVDVDAIYIASPHEHHTEHAIAAARAGKHVLVEKPMATNLADCRAMTDAAAAAGTVLMVGPSHAFDAPVALAARLIASGAHGRPRLLTAINYTDFLYRPRRPEELDSSGAGGVVFSQAAHQVDVVRRLAGAPVVSVRAATGDWDPLRSSEGAYTAFMTFAGGISATLTYSGYARYDSDELLGWVSEIGHRKDPVAYGDARRRLTELSDTDEATLKLSRAFGSLGVAAATPPPPFHEHFGFVLVSCERADLRLMADGVQIYTDEERRFEPLPAPTVSRYAVVDEFVRATLHGEPSIHDGRWGTETMACCLAIRESSRKGREVALGAAFAD
jgi:phthalate 4,5-cis-dihydrodiol dehydrogenase